MPDHPELRPPWSRSERRIPRTVVRPLQQFLGASTSSGYVLLVAVAAALVWANSPWSDGYERLWDTPLVLRVGDLAIGTDVRFWIGDGLMTLFFLVVGLEIKREATSGDLRRPRALALPAIAAAGGMAVPALLYLAVAGRGPGAHGWAIPMATDIALALGALALAGARAPTALKPLLLTLAIVDDIGAIIVVTVAYGHAGDLAAFVWAIAVVGAVLIADRAHMRSLAVYVGLGALLWFALWRAGVEPAIAGVVMGVLAPATPFQRPHAVSAEARRIAEATADEAELPDADAPLWLELADLSREAVSPVARVEHALLVWTSFVIVPLFALANAGVHITPSALLTGTGLTIALAIVVARVIGKPIGVVAATRLAVSTRAGTLPTGVDGGAVLGLGVTAGIGFTVALFIADLAFADRPELLDAAKVGVIVAAILAGAASWLTFRVVDARRRRRSPGPEPR
ncbi:MAG TPA: Na+/H+ antiporter NhaA [Actinomycetota bacterium]|nr:Na+/H+ antiporter NhaA [Actinomycetota bacterium]